MRPAAAISSARLFILAMYSLIVEVPLEVVAKATWAVLMIFARDWDTNNPSMEAHIPFAVTSMC